MPQHQREGLRHVDQLQDPQKENHDEVSRDAVYRELYAEMRRYRDYELTAATWYTAILAAILAGIVAMGAGADPAKLAQFLTGNPWLKPVSAGLVALIGFSGCYCVLYAGRRYDELRKYVTDNLEATWKDFSPKKYWLHPRHAVLLTLLLLCCAIAVLMLLLR